MLAAHIASIRDPHPRQSSTMSKPKPAFPLSFMEKLSPAVFLHRPMVDDSASETLEASRRKDPQLVLLLGWMDARDAHLARYIDHYRSLDPILSILLVKARLAALVWPSIGSRDAAPAVTPLQFILNTQAFQNLSRSQLLQRDSEGEEACIPIHATIFDSTPGVWSYQFNKDVLTASFKPGWRRLLALLVAHLVAMTCWVLIRIFGVPDNQRTWSVAHNDRRKNREKCRTYIYSDADRICPSSAVEAHAAEAMMKGFDVRLERFQGSGHVADMRTDTDRYWMVIRKTWDMYGRASLVQLFTFLRPNRHWTYRQTVSCALFVYFGKYAATVELKPSFSLKPSSEKDRFIIIHPAKQPVYGGILVCDPAINPVNIGAVWFPKPINHLDRHQRGRRVFLHLHGGAYFPGSGRDINMSFGASLLLRNSPGSAVFCPEYRLSSLPGGRFPAALQDAVAAYAYLVTQLQIPAGDTILSGDSAGAHLALTLLRYINAHQDSLPEPAAMLL
ncbi:uncharacterized protein F4807DRAFT_473019 [Annulohypoxylon truncatum]|uniref:uncharacterized protein n=1 Tax=Annulohypoxylon truncatum TaxID=327061 RepID=UPI002007B9EA|nr:uncharacterized protein F4807DRAFT_473019 [Annulohypoxylon truncatum]KAI1211574.1 hypothetical protein F4807DRAFT_473019 [Annulohypoxylon truncatum]